MECKYCNQDINESAKVCYHCHRYQNRIINNLQFLPLVFSLVLLFISGVQVYSSRQQLKISEAQVALGRQQFQESRIKRIEAEDVLRKADIVFSNTSTKSSKALEKANSANKQLDALNDHMSKTEKEFTGKFNFVNGNIQTLKAEVSSELDILKKRNELMALADQAIIRGDRKAYNRLLALSINHDQIALAEVLRIKGFYMSGSRIPHYKDYEKKSTESLIKDLKENPDFRVRGKAAQVLGQRKEKIVLEAVIDSIKSDKRLEVLKCSVESLDELTNSALDLDVFGDTAPENLSLTNWWNENKNIIEKDFK